MTIKNQENNKKLENIIKDINKLSDDMHKFGHMCDDYQHLINNIISQIKNININSS